MAAPIAYIRDMDGDSTARLIYLVLLGTAIVGWFFAQNRTSMGRNFQYAVVWGLIFVGVVAVFGLWGDLRNTVSPGSFTVTGDNQIELNRFGDGHYYVTASVNGADVNFVVDTGATTIVLTEDDAVRAGFDPNTLAYVGRARTANGEVRTAPVWLESIAIGGVEDQGIGALVNEGELDQSLLGMNYLDRFSNVAISDGKMILSR
ncbi:MAG: TIGR02281 family clan AA aspartic protease [Pseudomonadota bacterium]